MKIILRISLVLSLLLVPCCDNDSPTEPSKNNYGGKIFTGDAVEAARQVIPVSGGILTIDNPSDPLDGFEIIIPADGFEEDQEFVISQAEITSHELGSDFNPVSPLIKISSGGGYSDDLVTVKIPCKVPEGYFAMGFFYDETTEILEPVPVLSLDTNSVTLMTRHLSPSGAGLMKSSFRRSTDAVANLVVSSIQESVLDGSPTLSTGFTPGVDDWEFPNYGSYISPGGHCAGQTMSAMWYYYEKKLNGEPALNALFDEVNDPQNPSLLWADNPRGYRFASTIQEDQQFYTFVLNVKMQSWIPRLSWYSFIYSMMLTGEPQFVLVRNSSDKSGHALIAYKVSPVTGTLWIADPNYPGNRTRTIEYRDGFFQPYPASLVAGGPADDYDEIGYSAKSAHIRWSTISARWTEFENGTIGNDRFPDYKLWAWTGLANELVETLNTSSDSIKIYCISTDIPLSIPGSNGYQVVQVYDKRGQILGATSDANKGILTLPLQKGSNKLGFCVMGAVTNTANRFVDFKWTDIKREDSKIDLSKVKHITIGIMVMDTEWINHRGDTLNYATSPVAGANVTLSGNTLSGKEELTGDSVSVVVSGSSVSFYVKGEANLGSPGWADMTLSGSISSEPEVNDDGVRYEATGEAAVGAVINDLTLQLGGSWTWLGYSFRPSTTFGISFWY